MRRGRSCLERARQGQDKRGEAPAIVLGDHDGLGLEDAEPEHIDRIAVPTAAVRRDRAAKQLRTDRDGPPEMPLWLRRAV